MSGLVGKQVVGVFNSEDALENAVNHLQTEGFDHADISLLASEAAVESKLGAHYERVRKAAGSDTTGDEAFVGRVVRHEGQAGLVGGLIYVPALAASGAVVASGGALLPAIVAAAAAGGAGGMIGVALAGLLEKRHADDMQAEIDRGGLVLWVRTTDSEGEQKAERILRENGAHQIHSHEMNELPEG